MISLGVDSDDVAHLTYQQPMRTEAAAVLFVTAVLERMSHKYRNPRALRAVLLDAGHLGQTVAMTGTALGLGINQTAAFRGTEVEALLGVDGMEETAVYWLGVGEPAPAHSRETTPHAGLATAITTMFRRTHPA